VTTPVASDELTRLLDVPFTFVSRPRPVPGALRPSWRIPTILLLIRKCWGAKASLEQLHVLNWAIRDAHARETFLGFWRGEIDPDEAIVRYEPALNRALDLAVGLRLVAWTEAKRLTLTEKGRDLLAAIDSDGEVLVEEKAFVGAITSSVTQTGVEKLLRRWPSSH
jgi:hypothetical protein